MMKIPLAGRCLLIALVLAAFPHPARAGNGDVDGDGRVTVADAAAALRIAGGLRSPSAAQYVAASVTPDTLVTVEDALRIARVAGGAETALPTAPMGTAFSLTVSGDTALSIPLPGGFLARGRVTDASGKPFAGWISFRNVETGVAWGRAPFAANGDYTTVLPAGTWQAIAISLRRFTAGAGESGESDTAMAVGNPFTLSGDRANLNFTRPNLPNTRTVTFQYDGPSRPTVVSSVIRLWDAGRTAETEGLNYLESDVLFTPAARPVPEAAYWVDVLTGYGLSNSLYQDYYIYYDAALTVTRNTSRTLSFPSLYELSGAFTGPEASWVIDTYAEQLPVEGKDVVGAFVNAQPSGFLLAMPPGDLTLSIMIDGPFEDSWAERLVRFTMPSRRASLSVNLPALPAFRIVSGTVCGPDGGPLTNVEVRAATPVPTSVPMGGTYLYHSTAVTDALGRYALSLPDGAYEVSVAP